jgi:hypothetical protein
MLHTGLCCAGPIKHFDGESVAHPLPNFCLRIDTSEEARSQCNEMVHRDLELMTGDGYCGFNAWGAFADLVRDGPWAHPCLVFAAERDNDRRAGHAAAVLMASGCEGSMLRWCAEHGDSLCTSARRWHLPELFPDSPAAQWVWARLLVDGHAANEGIVSVQPDWSTKIEHAEVFADGYFRIHRLLGGTHNVLVYIDERSHEGNALALTIEVDNRGQLATPETIVGGHSIEIAPQNLKEGRQSNP